MLCTEYCMYKNTLRTLDMYLSSFDPETPSTISCFNKYHSNEIEVGEILGTVGCLYHWSYMPHSFFSPTDTNTVEVGMRSTHPIEPLLLSMPVALDDHQVKRAGLARAIQARWTFNPILVRYAS